MDEYVSYMLQMQGLMPKKKHPVKDSVQKERRLKKNKAQRKARKHAH